jgi:hypothetical protein
MERPQIIRALRISWTACCVITCFAVVALWVRSYSWSDECTLASRLMLRSAYGCVHYMALFSPYSFEDNWNYSSWSISDDRSKLEVAKNNLFRFERQSTRPGSVPYWLVVLLPATLTVVPWIRQLKWRFSLRTLLIAITLVAGLLGIIAAAI